MARENITPEQEKILRRKGIISFNNKIFASLYSDGHAVVSSASGNTHTAIDFSDVDEWKNIRYISCGATFLCAVDSDGNLSVAGKPEFDFPEKISGARAVECSSSHIAVLYTDGHVKCIGVNSYGECNTERWEDIVDICCGDNITAALRSDGTVLCAGKNAEKFEISMNKYKLLSIYSSSNGETLFGIIDGGSIMSTSNRKPEFFEKSIVYINPNTVPVSVITESGELIYKKTVLNSKTSDGHACMCAGDNQSLHYVTNEGYVRMLSGKKFSVNLSGNRIYESFDNLDTEREIKKADQEILEKTKESAAITAVKLKDSVHCSESMTVCVSANEKIYSTMLSKSTEKISGAIGADCGNSHLLILLANGTVKAYGSNKNGCCNTDSWRNVTSVCAGTDISLGVRSDGSVLLAGRSAYINTSPVLKWKNIVRVKYEAEYIAALDSNGKIQICGNAPFDYESISQIQNISDFCISPTHIVIYTSDRKVMTYGAGNSGGGVTSHWKNIRQVVCAENFTAALGYNGKIYAEGDNSFGQCEVAQFSDIVSISCGKNHIVALDIHGNVYAAGANGFGQCNVSQWKDIVAVYCGKNHTVGLDKSGFPHACGQNTNGQCDISLFRLFDNIEDYDKERNEVIGKRLVGNNTDKKDFSDESPSVYKARTELPTNPDEHQTPVLILENIRFDCSRYEGKVAFDSNGRYAVCAAEGLAVSGKTSLLKSGSVVSLRSAKGFITCIDIYGKVSCIGRAFEGIDKWENILSIDNGNNHISALCRNGKVLCASDGENIPLPTDNWSDIQKIACGNNFTLGLTHEGNVLFAIVCDDTEDAYTPISEISELTNIRNIFAFDNTAVAVDLRGKPHIFGNTYDSKAEIEALSGITDVKLSPSHIVFLTSDGMVYSFGSNEYGECNTQKWRNAVSISAADKRTVAVRADGKLLYAGKMKERFENTDNIVSAFCDEYYVCLISNSGELFCVSEAGMKNTGFHVFIPGPDNNTILRSCGHDIPFYISAKTLSSHMAVSNTEKAYIDFGNTLYVYNRSSAKTYFHSRENVSLTDCGNNHSAYIKNKILYLNGDNSYGQCDLDKSENAAYAACGTYTTALVQTDGGVKMCGLNDCGQCDTENINQVSMAACGTYHTAFLRSDGKVVCVGNNKYGQCDTSAWENIVYVSCGDYHTIGVTASGHVESAGDNSCSQLVPKNISGIACVACAPFSTLCLRFDGTLIPFGFSHDMEEKLLKKKSCVAIKCRENKIFITYTDGHVEII